MKSGNFQNGFMWWIDFWSMQSLDQIGYLLKKNDMLDVLNDARVF